MTTRMHSLENVADQCLPPHWTDSVRWLSRRLNRGELRGSRFGRVWMMSDDDVEFLIAKHRNVSIQRPAEVTDMTPSVGSVSFLDGLSDRSRSRLRRDHAS